MILQSGVGIGTYPFLWDGEAVVTVKDAGGWAGGTYVQLQWQDDTGDWHTAQTATSNGVYFLGGNYGRNWQMFVGTGSGSPSVTLSIGRPAA